MTEGLRVKKKIGLHKNTPSSNLNAEYETRKGRFLNMLSLFSVVSFENTECTTSSGTLGASVLSVRQFKYFLKNFRPLFYRQ